MALSSKYPALKKILADQTNMFDGEGDDAPKVEELMGLVEKAMEGELGMMVDKIALQIASQAKLKPISEIRRNFDGNSEVDWLIKKMIGEYLISQKIND